MKSITSIEKVFHHTSEKGNPLYIYNIMVKGGSAPIVSVFSQNVAKAFCKAVDTMHNDDMPIITKEIILSGLLYVVHHTNNKLQGLGSISTSCLHNEICLKRMVTNSICKHCYAASQQARQHGLDDNNALNTYILQRHLFSESVLETIPLYEMNCRIESFGDVANVIQARNYIRIIKAHKHQTFAIWSKNMRIWEKAFDEEGKPENATFVQSSIRENVRDEKANNYVDHIFTVWSDEKTAAKNGVTITCGGRKCLTCLRCYHKGNNIYVDELKK